MWEISENKFISEDIPHCGNKYLTGNGYFGVRGTMEEYDKAHMPAVNMAGIYDKVGDAWRESVNAPNPLYTYVVVDGKKYALPDSEPVSHTQTLDFRRALQKRKTVWATGKGSVCVECERFASMAHQHLIGMRYTFSADHECMVEIVTGTDGDVWDINGPHYVKVTPSVSDRTEQVSGVTGEKGITVTVSQCVRPLFGAEVSVEINDKAVMKKMRVKAIPDTSYTFEKIAVVLASCDTDKCADKTDVFEYESERAEHIAAWERIWELAQVEISGDDEAMHALNYSIYHLNCIAPRNLKGISIPARGLSGQVYKGAVFWDTEMFMMDHYIHTDPDVAKTLIQYRIETIDGARRKAAEYGLDGAYYAWESQEGGFEACSDYNVVDVFTKRPMHTHFRDKQYHISAAVVYGILKYINATGDTEILGQGAMEVIIECAKMYRSLLLKKADGELYEIHDVVGPDEYHERVNNNAYTNKMAQMVFKTAVDMIGRLDDGTRSALGEKYDLDRLREKFVDSAERIYIPSPGENGVIEQFDGYFAHEDVSVDTVRSRLIDPKEYWGGAYGVAADTQVIKQADVVAMLSIFNDEYDVRTMRRNWEYYEPRTEHGSSLSACMYSLLACYINDPDAAYGLFMKSAGEDLRKGGKEWAGLIYIGGTHPASEGGAWIVAIKGFAGFSVKDKKPVCSPALPKNWTGMRFRVLVCGKLYEIDIRNGKAEITERS